MQGAAVRRFFWSLSSVREQAPGIVDALARRRALNTTGPFNDGLKLALVAEGGAMRGVVAGGMVSAIERLGFTGCFDLMVGSSAGACALAYLRAGQARYGTRIFYEDINNRKFIDRARLLRGRPIVDIDFLVDEVFADTKRLDTSALEHPGADLFATATDVDGARTVLLSDFRESKRAHEILRATARMPLVAAGPVTLDGMRLLDGGMLMHIPIRAAVELGATHVLVILTKPSIGTYPERSHWADRHIMPAILKRRYGAALAAGVRKEGEEYEVLRRRLGPGRETSLYGVPVLAVAPSPDLGEIARDERDAGRLIAAAQDADRQMSACLGYKTDAKSPPTSA